MPPSIALDPARQQDFIPTDSPQRIASLLAASPQHPEHTHDQNSKPYPHKAFTPLAQEPNKRRVVGVPAAAIEVSEEGMGRLLRLRVLSIEGLG